MRRFHTALLALALLLVAGCEGSAMCLRDLPALVVEIRDARTGAALADGATAVVRWDGHTDTLPLAGGEVVGDSLVWVTVAGPPDQTGWFALTVTRSGYAPWGPKAVFADGPCAHGEHVVVALEPQALAP